MKRTLLFCLLCTCALRLCGQVEFRELYYPGNIYELQAKVNTPGTYTVLVNFHDLENYKTKPRILRVITSDEVLIRLEPVNPKKPGIVHFRKDYTEGTVMGRTDTNFVYRLPFSLSKKDVTGYWDDRPMIHSTHFDLAPGDSIFAMRKGVVTRQLDCEDDATIQVVMHRDGSKTTYRVQKEGCAIRHDEVVYPGTFIGFVSKTHPPQLRAFFHVRGLEVLPDSFWERYDKIRFATADGIVVADRAKRLFVPVTSEALITKEMTPEETTLYREGKLSVQPPPRQSSAKRATHIK